MYGSFPRTGTEVAQLVEALRPVADAARKKKYHTIDGAEKPSHFMLQLGLSVGQCRRVMKLIDDHDFATLLGAAR